MADFRRLDAASAPSAPQSRLAIRPLAARRSPTPSLYQWRSELRRPDRGREELASFVRAPGEWNVGDQQLAIKGLSIPAGLIASLLHRVVLPLRALLPSLPCQCGGKGPGRSKQQRHGKISRGQFYTPRGHPSYRCTRSRP